MEKQVSKTGYKTVVKDWLTQLMGIRQENMLLKNKLAEALAGQLSHSLVDDAEYFQQRFVDKDQIIELLRHDIATLLLGLHQSTYRQEDASLLQRKYRLLERDIQRTVNGFALLKDAFETYLSLLHARKDEIIVN